MLAWFLNRGRGVDRGSCGCARKHSHVFLNDLNRCNATALSTFAIGIKAQAKTDPPTPSKSNAVPAKSKFQNENDAVPAVRVKKTCYHA